MMVRNARFWYWHNGGWVKLTLRPEQALSIFEGGPTEEGYRREVTTFTHRGDYVRMEWCEDGRDCDGRYDRGGANGAMLDQLAARPMDGPDAPSENAGIRVPEWVRCGSFQRDYTAEAMGY